MNDYDRTTDPIPRDPAIAQLAQAISDLAEIIYNHRTGIDKSIPPSAQAREITRIREQMQPYLEENTAA